MLLFNLITVNNKNGQIHQFPRSLRIPSAVEGRWKFQAPWFDARRQKDRIEIEWEKSECAPFSNQNVKGPIFPESREKSLKGGQLLAAQFNQKIKHRGQRALTLHIEGN